MGVGGTEGRLVTRMVQRQHAAAGEAELRLAVAVEELEPVAGNRLIGGDAAQLAREFHGRPLAATLLLELAQGEAPAGALAAAMLAHDTVERARDAAPQREIARIDRQHAAAFARAGIDPAGEDQRDRAVVAAMPIIEPAEARRDAGCRLSDGCFDACRPQPVKRGVEPAMLTGARAAADERE